MGNGDRARATREISVSRDSAGLSRMPDQISTSPPTIT